MPGRRPTHLFLPAFDRIAETNLHFRRTCGVPRSRSRLSVSAAAGRWPNGIAELVPAFLRRPLDPFDGRPLRWKAVPMGSSSIRSAPQVDDGGRLDQARTPPGTDYGFRL